MTKPSKSSLLKSIIDSFENEVDIGIGSGSADLQSIKTNIDMIKLLNNYKHSQFIGKELEHPKARPKRKTLDEIKHETAALNNQDKKQDINLKQHYFFVVVLIVFLWLLKLWELLNKVGIEGNKFSLSDEVLITLLTTTTLNVLMLFYFIGRYLFSTKK